MPLDFLVTLIWAGATSGAFAMVRRRKTQPEHLPDHPVRRGILRFIRRNPGARASDVCEGVSGNRGTISYHLRLLEKSGLLQGVASAKEHRYFPPDFEPELLGPAALLLQTQILDLATAIRAQPGIRQFQLARRLSRRRKVIRQQLRRLERAGLIQEERGRQARRYHPTPILDEVLERVNDDPPTDDQ